MLTKPVVVIGGGIAGLSTALALAGKGYSVLVAEARTDWTETGAGLQLSPNASHILLRWGLGPALARTAVSPTALAIRRWGEPRAFSRMTMQNNDSTQAPFWLILRSDLHDILRDATVRHPLITLQTGWKLSRLEQSGETPLLTFETDTGPQKITASCVIGADGQRSFVRRLLGDARDLDSPGWEAWRTVIPAERTADFVRAAESNLWLGRDYHAVHYPVSAGRNINLVVIRKTGTGTNSSDGWSRNGTASDIASLSALAAPPLAALIHAAPDWKVWTLRDRNPSPYTAKGHAALVGDAAHPVLPFLAQGAALAIEDAAILAHSMPLPEKADPQTITAGLASYAQRRAARTQRVYKAARFNAFSYHLPPMLAWLRDRRIVQLGSDGMRQRYEWLYGWRSPE